MKRKQTIRDAKRIPSPIHKALKVTTRGKDTMTPREVSYESGIGLAAVYDEIVKRRLACHKIGNRHVISRINYQRWLEAMGRRAA